jgi:predicted dehydrogenase/threonine dehydrogenase-like Zn-dependent dehydrogenase
MKQVLQRLDTGVTELVDAPAPIASRGMLLIRTRASLMSIGTERMLVEFGQASLLNKARQQPDRVKAVVDKARVDGVAATLDAVRSKLAQPLPLGYSNAGVVIEVGADVSGFDVGDRVISNGPHAEIVRVPQNLCARIPDGVSDGAAAFTVVASIGLQGVRLAQPTLGETFAVIGTGLIGLMTVQMLLANGARVLAIDLDADRLARAKSYGADICNPGQGEDPVATALALTRGVGVDSVIIAASTQSSTPVKQAALMSRKRGRIVLVGVAGLELDRADFYNKELSFQVSCSYGPGRYDPAYEQQGQDYPIGFVRWTEQRNFDAVLDLMARGRLQAEPLISHRFEIARAAEAYGAAMAEASALGIVLDYPDAGPAPTDKTVVLKKAATYDRTRPTIGVIGAGNYASRVLIPAFKAAGAQLHTVAASGGIGARIQAAAHGFDEATSDVTALLGRPEIDTVAVVTRHDTHARFTIAALEAGKDVFVEKPIALTMDEVDAVAKTVATLEAAGRSPRVMVGFNRRFAPHIVKMASLLKSIREPKSFIMTVNAGHVPGESWVQDTKEGGGRIVGEACHFIDLMRFLADSPIVSVQARAMGPRGTAGIVEDKAAITLGFEDGSFGTVHYLANGHATFPKERIEVFAAGRVLQLDNFLLLKGFGWPGFSKEKLWRQDKGQAACVDAFVAAKTEGKPSPIPFREIIEVARVTIEAADLLRRQS